MNKIILIKICLVCEKEFVKKVNCSRKDWEIQRFCSINCSAKFQYQKKIAKFQFKLGQKALNPIKKGQHLSPKTQFQKGFIPRNKGKTIREIRSCGYCKKQFLARLTGKGLYCSYQCRGLAQKVNNPRPMKECIICRILITRKYSEDNKRWKDRRYCSNKCKFDGQGEHFRGAKNHNWKNGITPLMNQIRGLREYRNWFRDIFRRDNWTCQLCNARNGNGKKVILNADHFPKAFSIIIKENKIDSIEKAKVCKELWDLDNGRTLCVSCHKTETAILKKTL